MAWRVIGKDCACTIYDGGPQPGPPVWGSGINVKLHADTISIEDKVEITDVSTALADTRKRKRATIGESSIKIDSKIPSTGIHINIPLGNFVKIEFKTNSSFAVPATYYGLMGAATIEAGDGAQKHTTAIECDADGAY